MQSRKIKKENYDSKISQLIDVSEMQFVMGSIKGLSELYLPG